MDLERATAGRARGGRGSARWSASALRPGTARRLRALAGAAWVPMTAGELAVDDDFVARVSPLDG
jgi:hypothetical protein